MRWKTSLTTLGVQYARATNLSHIFVLRIEKPPLAENSEDNLNKTRYYAKTIKAYVIDLFITS